MYFTPPPAFSLILEHANGVYIPITSPLHLHAAPPPSISIFHREPWHCGEGADCCICGCTASCRPAPCLSRGQGGRRNEGYMLRSSNPLSWSVYLFIRYRLHWFRLNTETERDGEAANTHIAHCQFFVCTHRHSTRKHTHRKTPTSVVIVLLYVCVSFCPYYIDCVICAFSSLLSHVFIFSPLSLFHKSFYEPLCCDWRGEQQWEGNTTRRWGSNGRRERHLSLGERWEGEGMQADGKSDRIISLKTRRMRRRGCRRT